MLEPTREMEILFKNRLQMHQSLVYKNIMLMNGYQSLSLALLEERGLQHDHSKFNEPERTAYIWLTWMYHCKSQQIPFVCESDVDQMINIGWQHHIKNNLHHPEAHQNQNTMQVIDIVEMVCDWMAIHQETYQSPGSCLHWAENTLANKWHFSASKKQFIFATINELEHRLLLDQLR